MISFLSNWIEGIAIAVIIASIFEMLLPKGNIKKYIKVILGIYIVFNIISPFANSKAINSFDIKKELNKYTENTNTNKEEYSTTYKLNQIYENTFEKEVKQTVEREGFTVNKCEVKGIFNAEENNVGISKIFIEIEPQKTIKKSKEENDNSIKIENINEIEKVEINVGNKLTEEKNEEVNSKDIDTLKKYLSKHYEIDKGIIEIQIR